MSRIQFERRKRKKGYIIPLAIILLLYFTIPIYLINKGSSLITNSFTDLDRGEIYSPTVEFFNGVSFLNTAAAFPGFGKWSQNIIESSVNQMLDEQNKQFNKLCRGFFKDKIDLPEGVAITFNKQSNPMVLSFKTESADSSVQSILLNDSLLNYIDSTFCSPWEKFVDKTKLEKSKVHLFCK